MSLSARVLNVFATPEDVFDSIKQSEACLWNWLLPALLASVVGIVYVLIAFSQPNVQQQLREQRDRQLQKLVDSGKLSAADADAKRAEIDRLSLTITKIAGSVGAVVMSFVMVFVMAVTLKLMARWPLHATLGFTKALELAGLAGMISVLGAIVQMLLVIIMGNVAVTLGPVLFLGEVDVQNRFHLALASINLITVWYLCVLGIGLARFTGATFWKSVWPLLAVWVAVRAAIILPGWGSSGL